ncbi:hypothetical protein LX64_01257 [Chitinophaga skermanii]|uniref:Natural product n=1 Tax=Chitinophaga skermanii TaxID=331697 RepID=A0A327QXY7_9BACT|nr:class I lanthipeptide [Chitinophaga skermanii]RAJ08604.1 hypothetical protein LX64_01257 [Chitinophaga skermanii]
MKKKNLSLAKKLFVDKATIAQLTKHQQSDVKGGAVTLQADCATYDPQVTCESRPRPGYVCM